MPSRKEREGELAVLYVLAAPVVMHPPDDGSAPPPALMERLLESRILCVLSGDFGRGLSSEADAAIYLHSMSLKQPLPPVLVSVYAGLVDRVLGGRLSRAGVHVPRVVGAEEWERRLRRRILRAQLKALQRNRAARR